MFLGAHGREEHNDLIKCVELFLNLQNKTSQLTKLKLQMSK